MVLSGKPLWLRSVVFNFFFPLSIFEASLILANFTMNFLGQWFDLRRWQALILTGSISASHSRNMSQPYSQRKFCEMLLGMPETSRHSLLEYCSFAQHFLSTLVSWLDNLLFMFLLIARSDSSFVNLFRRSVSSLLIFVRVVSNLSL